jgi:hypothetical protein
LKAIYSSLVSQISSLEEEIPPEDRILHIYAPTELHCTVATLSSFKESATYFASLDQSGPINGEIERREVMSLWNLGQLPFSTSLRSTPPQPSASISPRMTVLSSLPMVPSLRQLKGLKSVTRQLFFISRLVMP